MIKKLNSIVPSGYNLDSGGNEGKHRTEETKLKIGRAHKGKTLSIEHRKILSISRTSKHISGENKNKLLIANTGRHKLPEEIQKIKEKRAFQVFTEETKQKLSISHLGNTSALGHFHSEDSKNKMTRSQKERWKIRKQTYSILKHN